MKMKNMLIGGMSLALVACISVGATLAYLTDKSDTATNTFTMQDGIELQLWETADEVTDGKYKQKIKDSLSEATTAAIGDADKKQYEGTNKGIDYSEILPGAEINKEPRLKVTKGTESWVYMKVTDNTTTKLNIKGFNTTAWTKVGEDTENNVVIYRYNTKVALNGWTETPLFDTLQVPAAETSTDTTEKLGNIVMEGYAIQSNGLTATAADTEMQKDTAFWGTCKVPATTTEVTE